MDQKEKDFIGRNSITAAYIICTENCNLRCTYCFERKSRTVANSMSIEVAKATVDMVLNNAKIKNETLGTEYGKSSRGTAADITFFGGEPTLRPLFMLEVLEYGYEKSKELNTPISFSIITNGTIYTDEYEKFLERWVELSDGNIHVQLSIDGSPDIQDANRPCANCELKSSKLLEETVPKYIDFYKRHNLNMGQLTIHACVSKKSINNIYNSYRYFVENLHIMDSYFAWVIEDDWDDDDVITLDEEMAKVIRYLSNRTDNVRRFPFKRFDQCSGCSAGRVIVCVDADGYIYPCHRFFFFDRENKDLVLGNILDKDLDLLHSEKRKPYIDFDITQIKDVCQICMATNYECTGSLYNRPNDYDARFMAVLNEWYAVYSDNCERKFLANQIINLRKDVQYLKQVIKDNGLALNTETKTE